MSTEILKRQTANRIDEPEKTRELYAEAQTHAHELLEEVTAAHAAARNGGFLLLTAVESADGSPGVSAFQVSAFQACTDQVLDVLVAEALKAKLVARLRAAGVPDELAQELVNRAADAAAAEADSAADAAPEVPSTLQ